ncbi:MAG: hypothetical protein ACW98I_12295 [Candidatus Hodarchaeales archaeon]|jgi:hypothetical protein
MSQYSDKLFDKWINGRFESKMVISVTQKDQFKNLVFSVINGRSYSTKLGPAMSIQLGPIDLQELVEILQEVQTQYFPFTPKDSE